MIELLLGGACFLVINWCFIIITSPGNSEKVVESLSIKRDCLSAAIPLFYWG